MKTIVFYFFSVLAGAVLANGLGLVTSAAEPLNQDAVRAQLKKTFGQGNFKDAYEGYRKLPLDPQDSPRLVSDDLNQAVQALQQLGRIEETDALLEEVIQVHKENWRLLAGAAQTYQTIQHQGALTAGKFYREQFDRGPGQKIVNALDRDRVRSLQLAALAWPLAQKEDNHADVGDYLLAMSEMWLNGGGREELWRLQLLTDLSVLPDYEEGWGRDGETAGAPVDAEGKPVFYSVPKTFESAENDGQRWRWCLQQAAEFNPRRLNDVRWRLATFLLGQFGVETMAEGRFFLGRGATDDTKEDESGPYAVHTLGENETIARLATGIKRFDLPDEFNYIKLFQQIAAEPDTGHGADALEQLARIFENRRQYPKAADYWRRLLKDYPGEDADRRKNWQQQLDQIVGNWGRFEPMQDQPSGQEVAVDYRFRNGRQVVFTAHTIKVEKLLDDVKAFLKSNPKELNFEKINIDNIGYRLIEKAQRQYVGEQVAEWTLDLAPRENHFDRRVAVKTPLAKPGAYLLTAKMAGGNTTFIVVWINDTAIVKKPLAGKTFYYVADAVSGKPVPKATVEFFGWQQLHHDKPQRFEVLTRQFAEFTDADGQVIPEPRQTPKNYQWLITARTKEGRFAYLGFTGIWYGNRRDAECNAAKAYAITDRPVYRPDQPVKYKFWVRRVKYDVDDASEFANQQFTVEICNPRGDRVVSEAETADAFGGIDGEYVLPADALLGVYAIQILAGKRALGGGSFRVEEYKKPEFEVTVDAPTEPVMLGDKITATIKAKYYFGSPVTNAKVKYTVNRTSYTERWYPIGPWDWFYGPGYWWFAYDCAWYPGWNHWGCLRPSPFWWPQRHDPPELIAQQEVAIGPDGTVKVDIDTAVAKAIHPDQDHSYSITAEVVDASRRTIVGTGNVLVARKPFTVHAWIDRGYYRVGDTIQTHFSARTLDGKPVQGHGELTLLQISYPQERAKPVETPVQTWQIDTDAEGMASQQITASASGQYRLSYKLKSSGTKGEGKNLPSPSGRGVGGEGGKEAPSGTNNNASSNANSPHPSPLPEGEGTGRTGGKEASSGTNNKASSNSDSPHPNPLPEGDGTGRTIEGGYLFTVIGEGFNSDQFRFNHLELIPDKREYAPGEAVKLQINTDRSGGTVLLFTRPANGVYLPPKVIHLDGKSTVEEIGVVQKDMPNFFVEAVTVADGRVHAETKEIVVPPEKRILNVEVLPSKDAYKPGEKAKVQIKLSDLQGKPFVGSTVVAVYDKSLEYISGGSNVPEIKAFFWKWRRQHHPQSECNLERWFSNLVRPNTIGMSDLGVFGLKNNFTAFPGEPPVLRPDSEVWRSLTIRRKKDWNSATLMKGGRGSMAAAPMPAKAPSAGNLQMMVTPQAMAGDGESFEDAGGGQLMVEPTIRTKFADTALWVGSLATEKDGTAEVALDMPENLTTWRIKTWAMGQGTRVGQGQTDVVTRKDLIIRLEAPRFFVQKDEVVLSAVIHNYLKTKKKVTVSLELDGGTLEIISEGDKLAPKPGHPVMLNTGAMHNEPVEIDANGEARVDWRVKVLGEGEAIVRMKALTDEESDAMEQKFPCYIHGMLKTESFSGAIRPQDESGKFTVDVPADRQPAQSRLEVRYSPTLAGAMVDALPYMVDYPYGCTEQTLNRFLPTVITQKILLDMKLDLKDIQKKRTNLNAQEIGDDALRAKQWEKLKSPHPNPLPTNLRSVPGAGTGRANPVFDEDEVRRMVKEGVQRLTEMQCSDGGWGWFSGWGEHSSPHTTAVVVHGLQIAAQNDVALVPGILERGVEWLTRYQDEQVKLLENAAIEKKPEGLRWKAAADVTDALVYMVLVDANVKNAAMQTFLYRDRTKLNVYGMTLLGLALEKQSRVGDAQATEQLAMVLKNIGQYVEQDNENQTAWLRLPSDGWWYWHGSEIEAEAYYLKLLAKTDPKGELAPRLVKYLLNNRKHATYWNSTRDTALCIEAMADFLRESGEGQPNLTVEVFYDGKLQKAVEVTAQNLFAFDNKFVLEGNAVEAGKHQVELRKKGTGALYFNGYLTNFTTEDFITKAGLEIKVNRKYYKLNPADKTTQVAGSRGQAVDQKVEKYERQELPNLSELKSGDLVEIELEIDSKNDYEYLIFEDMKPAGFEPVDLRSGYTGNDLGAYVEFRDNRVVFFARMLARGKHSVAYRMRAETPGKFSALPTRAAAMYAPELKANSDELKIGISD